MVVGSKLLILYLLNLTDIMFTLFLINSGYFKEANPIIAPLIHSPCKLFLVKIALPGLLLIYIYFRIKKANKPQSIMSNRIINGALCGYGEINLMHIYWCIFAILL